MITVSSITKNTSRYTLIHNAFFKYIPVNLAFNLPHFVTSYMHHTGKKETKKKVTKNFPQGDSNLGANNELELEVNSSIHWTTSVYADNSTFKEVYIYIYSFSMVIYSFQG